MLVQYVKGRPPMLSACQGTAIQIANFIQMKGADAFRVLSRAFAFVRFVTCYLFRTLQRVRFLPSFAVIVCAWVRLCALARCLRLFICRLRGFYCFCNTLSTLHAFARLCGLYCSRVYCSLFCAPPVRRFNDSEGQRWRNSRGTSPLLRGCVL